MKVIHVINSLGIGGTQKALELIVRNSSKEFSCSVCGIHSGGKRGKTLRQNGFDVFIADGSQDRIISYLRKKSPDILHLHGSGAGKKVTEAAVATNIPILVKSDNFGWLDEPSVAKRIDRYFFPSKMILLRHLLLNKTPIQSDWRQDYEVIHYPLTTGIDHNFNLRKRYGINPGTPLLGKIGRQDKSKWGRITISAFEYVVDKLPEVMLILVTPPKKIKQEVNRRGLSENIIYIDKVPPQKVSGFYDAIDILAHSSAIGESFGYVIAEAMLNKTPVVVNSTPLRDNAQIELVDNDETGHVANSPQSYADAIVSILRNKTKQTNMGRQAKQKVLSQYNISHVIEKTEKEYYDLLRKSGQYNGAVDRYKTDMAQFRTEYQQRLKDNYGNSDVLHNIEQKLWNLTTRWLPSQREFAYRSFRRVITNMME